MTEGQSGHSQIVLFELFEVTATVVNSQKKIIENKERYSFASTRGQV